MEIVMCNGCKTPIRAGEAYWYEANELCYSCYIKWVKLDTLTTSLMLYREGRV